MYFGNHKAVKKVIVAKRKIELLNGFLIKGRVFQTIQYQQFWILDQDLEKIGNFTVSSVKGSNILYTVGF